MVKRTIFFMQILLLLIIAGSAFGADIYYPPERGPNPLFNRSYWWSGQGGPLWSTGSSWWDDGQDYFPPGPNDVASFDNPLPTYCLIDSSVTAECLQLQVGHFPADAGTEPLVATLDVNGGTLTVVEDVLIGILDNTLPSDYSIGDVNIISGTVTVGLDLYIGREGIGILNMRGGTCDVNGTIWCPGGPMPYYNGQTYDSGTGRMNLYGGILSALDIDVWPDTTTEMEILGGTLIIDGDRVWKFKEYMQEDKLIAYDGRGEVIMDYNVTNAGKTTVTADVNYACAWGPYPRNYSIDVEPDVNLTWGPGDGAVKHDVYFGTVYSDVNEADDPNTLPGRGRQDSNSYDPELASDTAYYWRIDEVNGLTVHKGYIWEFKVRNLAQAYEPYPEDGQSDVGLPLTLDWLGGRYVANHDVYFGTDYDDVDDANTSTVGIYQDNVSDSNYPISGLTLGTEYYWRIDENDVNAVFTKGKVWSFTLSEYFGIDWFEDYDNTTELTNIWTGSNCSLALVKPDDFPEDLITESSAMKISYNPGSSPYYSEAVMAVPASKRDWTSGSAEVLELKFKGLEDNDAQKIYVEVTSGATKMVVHPDPNMLVQQSHESWAWWPIDLDIFADAGVNLSNVTQLKIGVGDKLSPSPGSSGKVYIDDIALRGRLCYNHDGDSDLNNDCAVDINDVELLTDDWLKSGYDVNATTASSTGLVVLYNFNEGSGTTAADSAGTAQNGKLYFSSWDSPGYDGSGSCVYFVDELYITVSNAAASVGMGGHSTVAMWIKDDGVDEMVGSYIGTQLFQAGPSGQGNLQVFLPYNGYFEYTCGWNTDNNWEDRVDWIGKWGWGYSNGEHPLGQWVHYAFVKDATEGVMRIYQNGKIVAEQSGTTGLEMPALDPLPGVDYFTLGAFQWSGGTGGYYWGLMDDFRLYNRALSQQEIMDLANVSSLHQPVLSSAEITDDDTVNFEDYAVIAIEWFEDPLLWP